MAKFFNRFNRNPRRNAQPGDPNYKRHRKNRGGTRRNDGAVKKEYTVDVVLTSTHQVFGHEEETHFPANRSGVLVAAELMVNLTLIAYGAELKTPRGYAPGVSTTAGLGFIGKLADRGMISKADFIRLLEVYYAGGFQDISVPNVPHFSSVDVTDTAVWKPADFARENIDGAVENRVHGVYVKSNGPSHQEKYIIAKCCGTYLDNPVPMWNRADAIAFIKKAQQMLRAGHAMSVYGPGFSNIDMAGGSVGYAVLAAVAGSRRPVLLKDDAIALAHQLPEVTPPVPGSGGAKAFGSNTVNLPTNPFAQAGGSAAVNGPTVTPAATRANAPLGYHEFNGSLVQDYACSDIEDMTKKELIEALRELGQPANKRVKLADLQARLRSFYGCLGS